jgi:hypothetical protein
VLTQARAVLAAAAALPLLLLGTAHAAGSGCRHLVVDPDRDTAVLVDGGDVASSTFRYDVPGLDVVSADLASNGKQLSVVVRLAGDANKDTTAATGQLFHVEFRVGLSLYEMEAFRSVTHSTYLMFRNTTGGHNDEAPLTGTFSADGRTLTMTAPASSFTALKGELPVRGTPITETFVGTGPSAAGVTTQTYVDTATTKQAYRAGSRSCA